MPKEVLRSGASTPAAPAATATQSIEAALATLRQRLEGMALAPEIAEAVLAAERKRLESFSAPVPAAAAPAPAPAPVAPPAPVPAPAPAPTLAPQPGAAAAAKGAARARAEKNVTPPAVPAVSVDPNEEIRRAYEEDHGTAPVEVDDAPGAEPDAGHSEDETGPGTGVVVQNHWTSMSDGAITGPIDRSDFKTPQLKLIQGSGPLSKLYNQGSLVYMDQVIFGPPDPQKGSPIMNFIPVAITKYFRENVKRPDPIPPGYVPVQPRNASTLDQVKALGGTIDFTVDQAGNRIKPSWAPAARCAVLIERPEGSEHPGFALPVEINGRVRYFAAAIFFVNGGQYRSFVKPIMDATNFILCEGTGDQKKIILDKRIWKMQIVKEQSGENMIFNPKIEMINELTPPELREFAKTLR